MLWVGDGGFAVLGVLATRFWAFHLVPSMAMFVGAELDFARLVLLDKMEELTSEMELAD
jgi:hypothetical protein